jgi:hypothetical protein
MIELRAMVPELAKQITDDIANIRVKGGGSLRSKLGDGVWQGIERVIAQALTRVAGKPYEF